MIKSQNHNSDNKKDKNQEIEKFEEKFAEEIEKFNIKQAEERIYNEKCIKNLEEMLLEKFINKNDTNDWLTSLTTKIA